MLKRPLSGFLLRVPIVTPGTGKLMDGHRRHTRRRAKSTAVIQSLQRGLGILELVAKSAAGVTAAQVSREIALHTSTAFHLLRTLAILGYLVQDEITKRYRLGSRVFGLAACACTEIQLLHISAAPLTEMANQTGDTSHLAIFDHGEVIMINRVEGNSPVGLSERVGNARPAHCSALGKVLLAHLTDAEVKAYLDRHGLKRWTPHTLTTQPQLRRELARVRRLGYAFDDEELARGIRCLAAPVRNFAGQVVAAVGISAPVWRLGLDRVAQLAAQVQDVAHCVSQHLGYARNAAEAIPARGSSARRATGAARGLSGDGVLRRVRRRTPDAASGAVPRARSKRGGRPLARGPGAWTTHQEGGEP